MTTYKLSELAKLKGTEFKTKIAEISVATQLPVTNEAVVDLDRDVAAFEQRHSMTSEALRRGLDDGSVAETWAVCQWLMALHLRDDLVAAKARQA